MSSVPAPNREQLRTQAAVNLVKSENEGFVLEKQPAGTYGFTGAPLEACPVFSKQSYQSWEVHRRGDGTRALICCVTSDHATLIASGQEPIQVTVYPEPHDTATVMITLDMARVIKRSPPSRSDGNFIPVTLAR